jgi:hypothetical protein
MFEVWSKFKVRFEAESGEDVVYPFKIAKIPKRSK